MNPKSEFKERSTKGSYFPSASYLLLCRRRRRRHRRRRHRHCYYRRRHCHCLCRQDY